MSTQHLSPSKTSSISYESASHTPAQALLASFRAPIASLDDLEDHLLDALAALDAVPPSFISASKTRTNISRHSILPALPTIQHITLTLLLPTWLTPLRDAGHLQLVRQLFCPSQFETGHAPHYAETRCKVVTAALPTILGHLPTLTSKDSGPTAILDLCLSLVEEITTTYPLDTIHRCLFSPVLDVATDSDATDGRRIRDWEDYVRAACSVPGKVANALQERTDIFAKESLEHGPYFSGMCVSAERLMYQTSHDPARGTLLPSQSHLLLKFIHLGLFPSTPPSLPSQPSFFASTLPTIRGRVSAAATSSSTYYWGMWAALVRSLPSTSQQTFLASLLGALDCDVGVDTSGGARNKVREAAGVLRGLLGAPGADAETAEQEQLWSTMMAIVCGPAWTRDIGVLRTVVFWIAEPQPPKNTVNEGALEKLLDANLSTWTDPEYIRHSLLSEHRYTSSLFLLTLAALPAAPTRLALHPPFIASITTYLGHLDKSVRRCGMLVAEVIAARCGKELEFGGWDGIGPDLDWARTMRAWQSDWTAAADPPAPSPVADTPPVTPTPTPDAAAYDSDDSLTGYASPAASSSRAPSPTPSELAEFETDPSLRVARGAPVVRPVYLAQLAAMLRSDGNDADEGAAERVGVGLASAEALVRRKKGFGLELEENAVELALALLRLHDNYELPGFDAQRQAALTALVACCPQKAALALVQQFFTNQYAVAQRVAVLAALALGARELAGLPVPAEQTQAHAAFPSRMLPPALHRRYGEGQVQRLVQDISRGALSQDADAAAEPVVRSRQLRVGRLGGARVTPVSAPSRPERTQTFADVAAEHFVVPLVNHMWRHLRGAAGQRARAGAGVVLGAVVLAQFLGTLAVLLHAARNAPAYLAVLAPEGLELALTLGSRPPGEDGDEDAAVLAAALEVALVVLDACVALDGGRALGLERGTLVLATGEWARGVFATLERGGRVRGGGGAAEERVGRAAAGVGLKVEAITARWGRSMVGTY